MNVLWQTYRVFILSFILVSFIIGTGWQVIALTKAAHSAVDGPSLHVDASIDQHVISPYIYGVNFAEPDLANALQLPVNRWGGHATTRYNWQNDVSNRASDWFFENIPNEHDNVSVLPNGSGVNRFFDKNVATGAESLLTIPLIGWVPKQRERDCGFAVSKYGMQQAVDPENTDCGNGVLEDGTLITGNDPLDTSIAIDETFIQEWLQYLIGRYGDANGGGIKFYALDNEPMLWNRVHRDVHPEPVGYDELRDRTYRYASALKATDPSAEIIGPSVWGWTGYFYSALDWSTEGAWWSNPVDRNAHGGVPFLEWYLQQMRAYEEQHNVRILDYLDVHFYPTQANVALSPVGDDATQALRLRSTRSLWDPTYIDESWIAQPVQLIPRMHNWVNGNYPNTKLSISEYNWGALDHINGALAQADVLGIFGREQLHMATLWDPPQVNDPGAFAIRMYRNYDGQGSGFGSISLSATSSNQEQLSIYAARRTNNDEVTLMVINKTKNSLTSDLTLAGLTGIINAEVYRYSEESLSAIVRETDQVVTASGFTATYPANSITLFILPIEPANSATATPTSSPTVTATTTSNPIATATQVGQSRNNLFLPILMRTGVKK